MIGQQIGPYNVMESLGQGGMGVVYRAMHAKLEQLVAIKVLSPEYASNAEMRERFVREAKLQVQLSHPNVVNILNYLEDSQSVYLVMEYVDGESLEDRLKREGPLAPSECCRIATEVLHALAFMHQRGIIHRDIKPSNIMLTEEQHVKVTDFGIAKGSGDKPLTRTGVQIGTVWYMSPEQIKGGEVNAASDVYALGITLYEMVTGQVPFQSDSEYEIMKSHVEEVPRDPVSINSQLSRGLCDVILKALAKDPAQRYQSAEELRQALSAVSLKPRTEPEDPAIVSQPPEEEGSVQKVGGFAFGQSALGLFDRKVLIVLASVAFLLIAFLTYVGLSSMFGKDEEKTITLPLTSVPSGPLGPASATVDRVQETEASGFSSVPSPAQEAISDLLRQTDGKPGEASPQPIAKTPAQPAESDPEPLGTKTVERAATEPNLAENKSVVSTKAEQHSAPKRVQPAKPSSSDQNPKEAKRKSTGWGIIK